MKTAYEYYKPLTTHDSSLSPAVHMLVANRLGMEEETEQFLERTMAVDMNLRAEEQKMEFILQTVERCGKWLFKDLWVCCPLIKMKSLNLSHICRRL